MHSSTNACNIPKHGYELCPALKNVLEGNAGVRMGGKYKYMRECSFGTVELKRFQLDRAGPYDEKTTDRIIGAGCDVYSYAFKGGNLLISIDPQDITADHHTLEVGGTPTEANIKWILQLSQVDLMIQDLNHPGNLKPQTQFKYVKGETESQIQFSIGEGITAPDALLPYCRTDPNTIIKIYVQNLSDAVFSLRCHEVTEFSKNDWIFGYDMLQKYNVQLIKWGEARSDRNIYQISLLKTPSEEPSTSAH